MRYIQMAKEKDYSNLKPGEPLSQSTVMVLSVTLGLCVVLIVLSFTTFKSWIPAVIGVFLALVGILCTLPNLKAYFRGKKIEKLIKEGKYTPPKKKDFHPNDRWGDSL